MLSPLTLHGHIQMDFLSPRDDSTQETDFAPPFLRFCGVSD